METIQITKQLITPSIAKAYLEANINNRKVSEVTVNRYINDMKNGKWKEDTGEPIKIAKSGRILDGQHRLLALVKSQCSIYFHVATGLDESVFDVLDTGKSRNASDAFQVAGIKNSNTLPSIITMCYHLQNGIKKGTSIKLTNAEVLKMYYDDEMFWQKITSQTNSYYESFARMINPSLIGGIYSHLYRISPELSKNFMDQLCVGINCSNIVNKLRNVLMKDKLALRKIAINHKIALIIKAWNIWIDGSNVKLLKFDTVQEEYPTAKKPKSELFTLTSN